MGKPTATAEWVAVVDLCAYEDWHTGSFGTVPLRVTETGLPTSASTTIDSGSGVPVTVTVIIGVAGLKLVESSCADAS